MEAPCLSLVQCTSLTLFFFIKKKKKILLVHLNILRSVFDSIKDRHYPCFPDASTHLCTLHHCTSHFDIMCSYLQVFLVASSTLPLFLEILHFHQHHFFDVFKQSFHHCLQQLTLSFFFFFNLFFTPCHFVLASAL